MKIIRSRQELNEYLQLEREAGHSVGLVPTMGALHPGHITLIDRSVSENDTTICSLFVNPTQFNNEGDLTNYPRQEEEDFGMLRAASCDAVLVPEAAEVYPKGEDPGIHAIDFGFLETIMEGKHRPGHFRGVGIIISIFFEWVQPNRSYYGEKDYQQLMVIQELNRRKNYGVDVIGCTTVRESDGLAMSSRNLRLTPEQRPHASLIYQCLKDASERSGKDSIETIYASVAEVFSSDEVMDLEYFEVADADSLKPISDWSEASRWVACTAAFAGEVRLIDNMVLNP